MLAPFRIAEKTYILPLSLPIGSLGVLPLNSVLIRAQEPVLIDTGPAVLRAAFLESLWSLVEPAQLRWIFISHDDRDHAGNLTTLLELCPHARLLTTSQGLMRLAKEWEFGAERVVLMAHGEPFSLGDRELVSLRPPLFDSPATRGVFDTRTRMYYGVDSFASMLPEYYPRVQDVPSELYVEGFNWLNRANAPWYALTDPAAMSREIDRVRSLDPSVIVSYHGPVAGGITDQVCTLLASMPRNDDLVFPDLDDLIANASRAVA
ncbi:MAG TPA: MBL fold metallo-hydrolase [Solirubrobacteraceae bacterium]|nr:MBL fold metallo-hydrolase [Solirubrobacteraceae bacterium]